MSAPFGDGFKNDGRKKTTSAVAFRLGG